METGAGKPSLHEPVSVESAASVGGKGSDMASQSTQSHATIQQWAESHGAIPTIVSRTGGMLRFEFDPGQAGSLTPVAWDEFFQVFDEKGLLLLYDDKPGSRFHKFVYPETLAGYEAPPARSRRRLEIIGGRELAVRSGEAKPGNSASSGASRSRRSLSRAGKESDFDSIPARAASSRTTRRATTAAESKTPKRTQKKATRSPRRSAA